MTKYWKFRPQQPDAQPAHYAKELQISPFLADILLRRGFSNLAEMDHFLSPRLKDLTPPDQWPVIPQAAELLVQELLSGKKLLIWGDYDVDGVTATALCLDVVEHYGLACGAYIPDRNKEGYGLNIAGLEEMAAQGYGLLLTVDCGISNIDAVQRAKELGMTVVISDHHLPPPVWPNADILCNPKIMPKEQTPSTELAGVGVAFYLMAQVNRLLARALNHPPFAMDQVLDLVALGTLADLMPLTGENRLLVTGGLKHIKTAKRMGIAALKMVSGSYVGAEMKSVEISFKLGPRLNAAGRIEHAKNALALLRTKDRETALRLAEHLDTLNRARRAEEERILQEARAQAFEQLNQTQATLVLYDPNWHPGIIGIVASRIVEEFTKPCFVLSRSLDGLKGSGRSIGELNLYELLKQVSHHLLSFGGHKAAAAITILPENLEAFRKDFDAVTLAAMKDSPPLKTITLDGELDLSRAFCAETLAEIALLEPFGQGNPEPLFASPPIIVERHDYLGYDRKNILLNVRDMESGIRMSAKGWRMANQFTPPSLAGKYVRLAYTLRLNLFHGIPQPELDIKDIEVVSDPLIAQECRASKQ